MKQIPQPPSLRFEYLLSSENNFDKIASAVEAYEAACAAGPIDLEEFLSHYPDIAEDLRGLLQLENLTKGTFPEQSEIAESPRESLPANKTEMFGRFELIEKVATGGMGTVYRARDPQINRIVALKRIRPEFCGDKAFSTRLVAEANALAKLKHSGIVSIYEAGTAGDEPFIAMEWVAGNNLSSLSKERSFTVEEILALMKSLCDAVQHFHDRGLIHRDLKPSNIMADQSQGLRVMITDFGLTKDLSADHSLTTQGEIVGTIGYMAPEQAVGQRGQVNFATDIYGLGTILYQLITGQPPFARPTVEALLCAVLQERPIEPAVLVDKIPVGLSLICMKCLEKLPTDRFQTALELKTALENYQSITAVPQRQVNSSRRWFLIGATASSIAAAALVWRSVFSGSLDSVTYWKSKLASEERATRMQAVENLKRLASNDDEAVWALVEHCRCPDRYFGDQLNGKINANDRAIEAFNEESMARTAREEVLPALVDLGDTAVPVLIEACEDPNSFVFLAGLIALSLIETDLFPQDLIITAIGALKRLPTSAPEYTYAQILFKNNAGHRKTNAAEVASLLITAFQEETHYETLDSYLLVISRSPKSYLKLVPEIVDYIIAASNEDNCRENAIRVLGKMGSAGRAALTKLISDVHLNSTCQGMAERIRERMIEPQ